MTDTPTCSTCGTPLDRASVLIGADTCADCELDAIRSARKRPGFSPPAEVDVVHHRLHTQSFGGAHRVGVRISWPVIEVNR